MRTMWEYAREYTEKLDAGIAGWGAEMDWQDFGADGWELVAIYYPPNEYSESAISSSEKRGPIAVFKRHRRLSP